MDDKAKVLERWPDAYCYKWGGWRDGETGFTVARDRAEHVERIGRGDTESEAWSSAAAQLTKGERG